MPGCSLFRRKAIDKTGLSETTPEILRSVQGDALRFTRSYLRGLPAIRDTLRRAHFRGSRGDVGNAGGQKHVERGPELVERH